MGREWFKSLDNTPNRRGAEHGISSKTSLEAETTAPKSNFSNLLGRYASHNLLALCG